MKIKSEYLGKEFDVEVNETVMDGRKVQLIPHSVLTDIFYNQLPRDKGIRHEIEMTHVSLAHCVAKCTIIDNEGRRIIEIGESVRSMLVTEIAKSIPATMAQIRAFDRAVIRYLALPDKNLYSKEELETELGGSDSNAAPATEKAKANAKPAAKAKDDRKTDEAESAPEDVMPLDDFDTEAAIQDYALTDSDDGMADIPPFLEEEAAKATNQTGGARESAGATVVNFGKFMNKGKTVAQICDDPKNLEWAKWAIRQTADTKAKREQIEAIKVYIGA